MNETVRQIWEEVGAQRDETAHGFFELSESASFESEAFLRAIDPLRKFLGCGFAVGHRRPAPEFFETLLSRGRSGATALLDAFIADAPDPRSTALPLWRAVSAIARRARSRGFIAWDLDDWKPTGGDDSKARLVGYLPRDVDEQLRALAWATRRQLSEVLTDALREYVARHERKSGPLPRRPETAQAGVS